MPYKIVEKTGLSPIEVRSLEEFNGKASGPYESLIDPTTLYPFPQAIPIGLQNALGLAWMHNAHYCVMASEGPQTTVVKLRHDLWFVKANTPEA